MLCLPVVNSGHLTVRTMLQGSLVNKSKFRGQTLKNIKVDHQKGFAQTER